MLHHWLLSLCIIYQAAASSDHFRHIDVNSDPMSHVSHVSHNLPGQSTVLITRYFRKTENNQTAAFSLPIINHQDQINSRQPKINHHTNQANFRQTQLFHETNFKPIQTTFREHFTPDTAHSNHLHTSQKIHHSPFHPDHQGLNGQTPGPFAPRFQVARYEVSDEEWKEEIKEGFASSGLIPLFLPSTPPGLVNINYGLQACVHMGTNLTPDLLGHPPTRVSYPATRGRFYSLVMVDVGKNKLHWLLVNIPETRVPEGTMVAEYLPPTPTTGSGSSKYAVVSLLQTRPLSDFHVERYRASLCQTAARRNFSMSGFLDGGQMEEVVAANFFLVDESVYGDSFQDYCRQLITDV